MELSETSPKKREAKLLQRYWVRIACLVAAVALTFVLFQAPLIRPIAGTYSPPGPATTDYVPRDVQERIVLELAKSAVSEIRQYQEAEDRWFNYKFILIGGLLGAFLARFALDKKPTSDSEERLGQLISSSTTCCALAFATIVALTIDIRVRTGTAIIYQIGNWLAAFAEPTLLQIAGNPRNFLPWEMFLRTGDNMHTDAFYIFALEPNLHLATLIIYLAYLGVLQEISLKSRPTNLGLTLASFALVQFTLLLFAWMSHTQPGAFQSQVIPFVDLWVRSNKVGFLYILPWLGITLLSVPYLYLLYQRRSSGEAGLQAMTFSADKRKAAAEAIGLRIWQCD